MSRRKNRSLLYLRLCVRGRRFKRARGLPPGIHQCGWARYSVHSSRSLSAFICALGGRPQQTDHPASLLLGQPRGSTNRTSEGGRRQSFGSGRDCVLLWCQFLLGGHSSWGRGLRLSMASSNRIAPLTTQAKDGLLSPCWSLGPPYPLRFTYPWPHHCKWPLHRTH